MEQNLKTDSFLKEHSKEISILILSVASFLAIVYFLFFYNKTDSTNQNITNANPYSFSFNFGNLFNFSSSTNISSNSTEETKTSTTTESFKNIETLTNIYKDPVAGYSITYNKDNSSNQYLNVWLNFIDSNNGNIYKIDILSTSSSLIKMTQDADTFKNIYKAYFMNNDSGQADRVVIQFLDKKNIIKTAILYIPANNFPSKIKDIKYLPDNISNISISKDGKKLLYIVSKEINTSSKRDVYSDWYLIGGDNLGDKIYSSPLTIWNTIINNNGEIFAYEKDSSFEYSNLYKLDIQNQKDYLENKLNLVYGNHTGLSFIIGKQNLITSINTSSGIKTYLLENFNKVSFNDSSLKELEIKTLSKKCAFDNQEVFALCSVPKELKRFDNGLIDSWYQGLTDFADDIYYVDLKSKTSHRFFNLSKESGISFDTIDPLITDNSSNLILINKGDRSLWSINLNNLIVNNDGGE